MSGEYAKKREHLKSIMLLTQDGMLKLKEKLISKPEANKFGNVTSRLAHEIRIHSISDYVLNHNKNIFYAGIKKYVRLKQKLLALYDSGKSIDESYVTMTNFQVLFDALATGDMVLSEAFAQRLGGRYEPEKNNDSFFARSIGYLLKSLVLKNDEEARKWLLQFLCACINPENRNFCGYAEIFSAILEQNLVKAERGFKLLMDGHQSEVETGIFYSTMDQYLCMWGLGMAKLAYSRGLFVQINHPLIPIDLLV